MSVILTSGPRKFLAERSKVCKCCLVAILLCYLIQWWFAVLYVGLFIIIILLELIRKRD